MVAKELKVIEERDFVRNIIPTDGRSEESMTNRECWLRSLGKGGL